jgi:hypothetical protein
MGFNVYLLRISLQNPIALSRLFFYNGTEIAFLSLLMNYWV